MKTMNLARLFLKTVKLKRTFNMEDGRGGMVRFWRVVSPVNHPNYNSDLSQAGLKEWRII